MTETLEIQVARLQEQLVAARYALELQGKEYERRLQILNHEAEQLKEMQAKYMPREVADNEFAGIDKKIRSLERLVYIGVGLVLAVELLLKVLK